MMNLTNMRIGKRLAVGFGIAVILTMVISITGWWASQALSTASDKALGEGSKALLCKAAMLDNTRVQAAVLKIATAPDKEHAEQYAAQLADIRVSLKAELGEMAAKASSETSRQLVQNFTAGIASQRETNNQAIQLATSGKRDEALQLLHGEAGSKMAATAAMADQLSDWETKKRAEAIEEAAQILTKVHLILGILSM